MAEEQRDDQLMRILVTGGAGYIGSVVAEELLNQGHTVVVYDNLSYGHREAISPAAEFVPADLLDGDTLGRALKDHAIEAVMHMAAYALVGETVKSSCSYFLQPAQPMASPQQSRSTKEQVPIQPIPTVNQNWHSSARCAGMKMRTVCATRACVTLMPRARLSGAESGTILKPI